MNSKKSKELSLAKMNSALARQFHPTLNGYTRPMDVSYSNRSTYYWWKCEKDHEWQEKLSNRIFRSSCPKCELYSHSLAKNYPELLKEWDYAANDRINPEEIPYNNISKTCHWICPEGHKYTATVRSRTMGKEACPHCPKQEKLMIDVYPEIVPFWVEDLNIEKIEKVPAKSKNSYIWDCGKGHKSRATIREKAKGYTCERCLISEKSLAVVNPQLAKEWSSRGNKKNPAEVMYDSTKKYWWECAKHNVRWQQSPLDRSRNEKGCPACDIEGHSLKVTCPELATEWDYEKNPSEFNPENVTPYNFTSRIWWKCSDGHSWAATLRSRINKQAKCPECKSENKTLADMVSPELYAEWVPYLNNKMPEDVNAKDSNLKYWWMCKEQGHLDLESINSRKRKTCCAKCEEEKRSLAFNAPIEVLSEWDTSKNDVTPLEVYYKSTKPYWWLDEFGKSYSCSPQIRINRFFKENS